jgi:hypothetical protein
MEVPHGCVGRIGVEYTFCGEQWKLHRVGGNEREPYVFQSVKRLSAFMVLTLRRFLKMTRYAPATLMPWEEYLIPCFQCRRPIPGLGGSVFCAECK